MKKFTRRKILKGSAYVGAAATTFSPLGNAAILVPTTRSSKKAVVIGSGFGGSVTSLRLAKAGIPVTLVERGRNWEYKGENTFPTLSGLGDGLLWVEPSQTSLGSTGLLQQIIDPSGILVGLGAGLGGGSLVYGGVLLQPRREIFQQALPNISYDDMATKYYPRVLQKVSGGPIPDDILNSPNYTAMRAFIDTASRSGMSVVRSEVGFNWNIIREEVTGQRKAFASVGEWVFGCNSGAKNTLDKNYIAEAKATGKVEIRTLHNVVSIRKKAFSSNYEVVCEVYNQAGFIVANHIIECQYLFLAAGSVYTTKLLLKAKALGDIRTLNDGIGKAWGTNGDELMAITGVAQSLGSTQGGPPSIAAFDLVNPIKPVGYMHAPTPVAGTTTQLHMGMCIPDQTSKATYNFLTDKINLNWSKSANAQSHNALMHTAQKMAVASGGAVSDDPGSVADLSLLGTWHPLGGAAMGYACNNFGELYGTPNVFVVDGALIPGSSGAANPSLTIGANAERIMEYLVPKIV